MAEAPVDLTTLPIDQLPEIPLPDPIPIKREEVKEFLKAYTKVLKFLETWARVHLRVVASHPASPTPGPDTLIDELSEEDLQDSRDRVFSEFNTAHHHNLEIPVGFLEDSDVDENVDELKLVDPSRKRRKGSLFKRLLKWPKRQRRAPSPGPRITKAADDDDLEAERMKPYEELKSRFAELLLKEVDRYKDARDSRMEQVRTPVLEGNAYTEWIENMNQRLHVCHMAFKILIMVKDACHAVLIIQGYGNVGPGNTFMGDEALILQSRIAYLKTTKVLAFMLVKDTENIQLNSDTYRECVDQFILNRKKRETRIERKVRKKMAANESILTIIEDSPVKIKRNLGKEEVQQALVYATDGDNIDLNIPHPMQIPAETTAKKPALNVAAKIMSPSSGYGGSSVKTGEGLLVDVSVPPVQSPDPNQPGDLAVPSGSAGGDRPSFLNLPNPLIAVPVQQASIPEEVPSPMEDSPTEKVPSDDDDKKD